MLRVTHRFLFHPPRPAARDMGDTYVERVHSFKYIKTSSSGTADASTAGASTPEGGTSVWTNTICLVEKLDQQPTLKCVVFMSLEVTPEHGNWEVDMDQQTLVIKFNARYGQEGFDWLAPTVLRRLYRDQIWRGVHRKGDKIVLEHIQSFKRTQNGDWEDCDAERNRSTV